MSSKSPKNPAKKSAKKVAESGSASAAASPASKVSSKAAEKKVATTEAPADIGDHHIIKMTQVWLLNVQNWILELRIGVEVE